MNAKRKSPEKIDFDKFVEIYNTSGKKAALSYVTETYGVTYNCITKRLKKETDYTYSHRGDKYVRKTELESPFLTIDELCLKGSEKDPSQEEIILNLIKDKFFEISKFIVLEQNSKKILFKSSAAKVAGYSIEFT